MSTKKFIKFLAYLIVISTTVIVMVVILGGKEVVYGESVVAIMTAILVTVARLTTLVYLISIPILGVKLNGYKFLRLKIHYAAIVLAILVQLSPFLSGS